MRLPDIRAIRQQDQQVSLELHVSPTLDYFEGHFPGMPILPGVVQLDWAARLGREQFKIQGNFVSLENVKFQALVLPDAMLTLSLSWTENTGALSFRFTNSERTYSSGRLIFEGAA